MSTIKLLLERQAAAVKAKSEKLKQAETLDRQAAALRAEANKPATIPFKALRQAKEDRLSKFAKAMFSDELKQAEDLLTASGWQKDASVANPDSKNVWVNPKKPGLKIEISGSNYIVYKNDQKQLDEPLSYLKDFLKA